MTRPYSNDLRERVVSAVEAGETCRSASAKFGVSVSTVVKWSQRYRRTGSVAPGQMPDRPHGLHRVFARSAVVPPCPLSCSPLI